MTYRDGRLAIPLRPYNSWVEYADARQDALDRLERAIRVHLNDGGTIRETHNGRVVDWTNHGAIASMITGADVVEHLMIRYLGFGTTLEFLQ